MNDKEKLKEVLEFIDSFLVEKGGDEVIVNWDGRTPRDLLKLIKRDLEKMNWSEKEKLEEIVRYVLAAEDSRGLIHTNPIKKILEK